MNASREEQLAWVRAIMAYMGLNAFQLARRAGLSPSTLHKPLNEPDNDGMLSGRSLAAIAEAAGLAPLEFPARMRGMAEPEAEPFLHDRGADSFGRAVRELCAGRNGRDPWVMKTYVLELAGILPGDVMIVDLNAQPKPRDIVCAQIYDWTGSKTETVFRRFDPPFLTAVSLRNDKERPVMVDGSAVVIKGVVENILRRRAL